MPSDSSFRSWDGRDGGIKNKQLRCSLGNCRRRYRSLCTTSSSSSDILTTNKHVVRRSPKFERQVGAPPALRAPRRRRRRRQPPLFQVSCCTVLAGQPRRRRLRPEPGPHVKRPGRLRGGGGGCPKQAQNGADQGCSSLSTTCCSFFPACHSLT